MNISGFIEGVESFFNSKYNKEQKCQIYNFLKKKDLSDEDIDNFYDNVIEHFNQLSYKKTPLISDLSIIMKGFIKINSDLNYRMNDLKKTEEWRFDKILSFLKIIRKKDTHLYTNYDIDFLAKWEDLGLEAGFCKDYRIGKEMAVRHLRYVKESIKEGKPFETICPDYNSHKIEKEIGGNFENFSAT